jgi:hypothetical protein
MGLDFVAPMNTLMPSISHKLNQEAAFANIVSFRKPQRSDYCRDPTIDFKLIIKMA